MLDRGAGLKYCIEVKSQNVKARKETKATGNLLRE
jgi:hypothetical protein